jgi:hypothetical protein
VLHSLNHALQPGSSSYAALKVSAVAGVAGVNMALRRRSGRHAAAEAEAAAQAEREQEQRRTPHPRSRKKKRRRR